MILFFTDQKAESDRFLHYCFRYYKNIMLSYGVDVGEEPKVIREEGKKPRYDSEDVHFNISHSHGVTVVAISHCEVGVDVEKIRAVDFGKFSFIEASSPREFFEKWTERESFVKYTGKGIRAIKRDIPSDLMVERFDVFDDFVVAVCSEPQNIIAYQMTLDEDY